MAFDIERTTEHQLRDLRHQHCMNGQPLPDGVTMDAVIARIRKLEKLGDKKEEIRKWMRALVELNDGELDATHVAEEAADEFNIYENEIDFPIPEWMFELSAEVVDQCEQGRCESAQARSEDPFFGRE